MKWLVIWSSLGMSPQHPEFFIVEAKDEYEIADIIENEYEMNFGDVSAVPLEKILEFLVKKSGESKEHPFIFTKPTSYNED